MTTPTPRTERPNDDEVICPNCVHQFRAIPVNVQADLAAREAELAKMLDEREGNTRQFRRLQDRLAQAEADEKFWKEVSAEQRAELLKIAENPYEGNESALDYSCTHWKQRAEAAERELENVKAENSKLRSALEIVHFKREPWQ